MASFPAPEHIYEKNTARGRRPAVTVQNIGTKIAANPGRTRVSEAAVEHHDVEWEIASKLQTTLDIKLLIKLFFDEVVKQVPCESIVYEDVAKGLEIRLGDPGRHSCSYTLQVEEREMGNLTFTRRSKFTELELKRIEYLLCVLVYPLRNGLMYREATQAALRDPLTGVFNRTALDAVLPREVEMAHRHGTALSLVVLDVDHFKSINDNFGHATGDCALRALTEQVGATIRGSDILFRYGGEEFAVLLSNTDEAGAALLAERMRAAVQGISTHCNGVDLEFTISLGVATLCQGETVREIFDRADKALYEAKAAGRNCVKTAVGG